MKVRIDAAGRLIVPKTLRDELGLEGGMELEIRVRDGRLEEILRRVLREELGERS